jgi:hypothetical protein
LRNAFVVYENLLIALIIRKVPFQNNVTSHIRTGIELNETNKRTGGLQGVWANPTLNPIKTDEPGLYSLPGGLTAMYFKCDKVLDVFRYCVAG